MVFLSQLVDIKESTVSTDRNEMKMDSENFLSSCFLFFTLHLFHLFLLVR